MPSDASQPTGVPNTPEDLEAWKERLKDIPDLRWERVLELRAAIDNGEYDVDARVNDLLSRVENDVGVLCRRENGDANE
jgi:anti-sigma28 factor (negative regulator of flagellin synthesis)